LRERWSEAAWFVDPDDPVQLADALRRLLDDPAQARSLGQRAWERSRELGGPARFGEAHRDLYAQLARAPSVAGR
jgi:glycosyltransferase involved in cell wall biosynthesis